jgi:hypothetical protein
MNSKRFFVLFALFAVVLAGVAYFRFTGGKEKPIRSSARSSSSPLNRIGAGDGGVRTAKSLHLSKGENVGTEVEEKDLVKQSAPTAELDAKFATWRDDGRKIVEDMFGGDRQKIGAAFSASMQNEDFRATWARSRELEREYRTAGDDRKPAIMEELASLREKGLAILKQNGNAAAPGAVPNVTVVGGTVGTPAAAPAPAAPAAPAPAPAAPVVFQ